LSDFIKASVSAETSSSRDWIEVVSVQVFETEGKIKLGIQFG